MKSITICILCVTLLIFLKFLLSFIHKWVKWLMNFLITLHLHSLSIWRGHCLFQIVELVLLLIVILTAEHIVVFQLWDVLRLKHWFKLQRGVNIIIILVHLLWHSVLFFPLRVILLIIFSHYIVCMWRFSYVLLIIRLKILLEKFDRILRLAQTSFIFWLSNVDILILIF